MAFLIENQPVSGVEIIPIALHVDYWDRLGWKDEFASPFFSARQGEYAGVFDLDSVYTPQMVVDGRYQFTGSDLRKARAAITEAAVLPKGKIEVEVKKDQFQANVSDLPPHDGAELLLAITEDGLRSEVKNGENAGRSLPHTAVLRELKVVAIIPPGAKSIAHGNSFLFDPKWKEDRLNAVFFVQSTKNMRIIAVSTAQKLKK